MRAAVHKKFTIHKKLGQKLAETGNFELIEKAAADYYWGCGRDGSGRNMLGKILMEVREEQLHAGGPAALRQVAAEAPDSGAAVQDQPAPRSGRDLQARRVPADYHRLRSGCRKRSANTPRHDAQGRITGTVNHLLPMICDSLNR